ncbi:MAG: redoxin domain-containing protein [Bacteroidia bacterium]|nr:redoxin domain-containing protein [Bacteroidia bacterium]
MAESIYPIRLKNNKGEEVPLGTYQGKVLMIVNIATRCGFAPQLKKLEKVYQKYKDKGFVVIGIPSNDFGGQNPENDEETMRTCQVNYGVSFPIFSKVSIKGKNKHPLYEYLTRKDKNGKFSFPVFWNYQKYLIDKQGRVRRVFLSMLPPSSLIVDYNIRKLLSE